MFSAPDGKVISKSTLNLVMRGLCWASRWAREWLCRMLTWPDCSQSTVATWCSGTEIRLFHKLTAISPAKTTTVPVLHVCLFTMTSAPLSSWQCKPHIGTMRGPREHRLAQTVTVCLLGFDSYGILCGQYQYQELKLLLFDDHLFAFSASQTLAWIQKRNFK